MRIAIGSDHAGFECKDYLRAHLEQAGHDVVDCGCTSTESCDYPEFGAAVARAVSGNDADRGVLVCGTGIGISMAANKVAGVRAAPVHDLFTAEMSRKHNDANVVAFGARTLEMPHARELLDRWLATEFEGGRHQRRVDKINALDPDRVGS